MTNKLTILADVQNILGDIRNKLAKLVALATTTENKNLRISILKFVTDSVNLNMKLLDATVKEIPTEIERKEFEKIMKQNFGRK